MVIDGDSTAVEEQASPGTDQPTSAGDQPSRDFSSLHGFQFVGAKDGPAESETSADDGWGAALTLELDARATRFHHAVDSSIVLASDGAIRWLGDPIARLAAGDDVLAPRTILLADPAMSEEAQQTVRTRLELWLNATVQRLLGPLFSLRTLQEGSQQLQELAARIANALGVLEREPVRGVVRNLDQTARGVLRKHGVRFGSYYLYVPSTLRPAARALALQLSCIRKGDEAFNAAAQGLIPMASSGRTSAVPDPRINAETYRVGGFRACGDRVVRVDIVERLADMIRAASVLRVVGADSAPPAFQVTSQMTSLTGCSGDGFASILKALGFESVSLPRREVVWPAAAAPVAAPAEAGAAPADEAAIREDAGEGVETSAVEDAIAPLEEAEAAAEAATDEAETAQSEHEPEAAAEAEGENAPADEAASDDVAAEEEEPAEAAAAPADQDLGPADDPAGPETADTDGETISDSSASPAFGDESMAEPMAVDASPEVPTEGDATASSDAAVAGEAAPGQPGAEEMVTIWRFVRQRTAHPPRRPRPARRPGHAPGDRRAPASAPSEGRTEAAPTTGGHPAAEGRGPHEKRAGHFDKSFRGKPKWDADKGQRPERDKREPRAGSEGRPGGDRKPAIDPMSPFAKLMELRSILEAESKKRK